METVSSDSMISSTHGNVLKDLNEKLTERKRVFLKTSTELARKQAWYRSVALGKHRKDLLCWMLSAILKTLEASFVPPNADFFFEQFANSPKMVHFDF